MAGFCKSLSQLYAYNVPTWYTGAHQHSHFTHSTCTFILAYSTVNTFFYSTINPLIFDRRYSYLNIVFFAWCRTVQASSNAWPLTKLKQQIVSLKNELWRAGSSIMYVLSSVAIELEGVWLKLLAIFQHRTFESRLSSKVIELSEHNFQRS